ncbi:MAG TPA: NAD-dependent DNA ligase LigA, partial [Catenuloplanes sp.]
MHTELDAVGGPVVDAARATPFATPDDYAAALATVRDAARAYYNSADIVMDDAGYDALVARVAATETAHPTWRPADSPTAAVAAGVAVAGDVVHTSPMLSLDNVFGEDDLLRWAARLEKLLGRPVDGYTVEPKIDGLAVAARYVDGRLTQIATRGDGRAGEDVSTQSTLVVGLPQRLTEPVTVEVRGEVF